MKVFQLIVIGQLLLGSQVLGQSIRLNECYSTEINIGKSKRHFDFNSQSFVVAYKDYFPSSKAWMIELIYQDRKTEAKSHFKINIDSFKDVNLIQIGDVCLIDNGVIITLFDHLIVYDFEKSRIIKVVKAQLAFRSVTKANDSTLILWETYNHHSSTGHADLTIGAFDLKVLEFTSYYFKENIDGIGFSMFRPNSLVSILDKSIIYLEPLNKRIFILNMSLEVVDSITPFDSPSLKLKRLHDSVMQVYPEPSSSLIMALLPFHKKYVRYDRIISLSKDSILLYRNRETQRKGRVVDLLVKVEEEWILQKNYFTDSRKSFFSWRRRKNFCQFSFVDMKIKYANGELGYIFPSANISEIGKPTLLFRIQRNNCWRKNSPIIKLYVTEIN